MICKYDRIWYFTCYSTVVIHYCSPAISLSFSPLSPLLIIIIIFIVVIIITIIIMVVVFNVITITFFFINILLVFVYLFYFIYYYYFVNFMLFIFLFICLLQYYPFNSLFSLISFFFSFFFLERKLNYAKNFLFICILL